MRYKEGDNVVIVSEVPNYNFICSMERFLGKTVTILKVMQDDFYKIIEDDENWAWQEEFIDHEATANLNLEEKVTKTTEIELSGNPEKVIKKLNNYMKHGYDLLEVDFEDGEFITKLKYVKEVR